MLELEYLLCRKSDYHDDFSDYLEELYIRFCEDFIQDQPMFGLHCIDFTGKKIDKGKQETFWKLISSSDSVVYRGNQSSDRNFFYPRAERIRWIKPIIDNYPDDSIRYWAASEKGEIRHHLWYKDEYIVVIGQKGKYFFLVTAFYVIPDKITYYMDQFEKYKKMMSP